MRKSGVDVLPTQARSAAHPREVEGQRRSIPVPDPHRVARACGQPVELVTHRHRMDVGVLGQVAVVAARQRLALRARARIDHSARAATALRAPSIDGMKAGAGLCARSARPPIAQPMPTRIMLMPITAMMVPVTTGGKKRSSLLTAGAIAIEISPAAMMAPTIAGAPSMPGVAAPEVFRSPGGRSMSCSCRLLGPRKVSGYPIRTSA